MSLFEKLAQITTFIFDVDGVLTDGSVFVFDNGEQTRVFNIKDGYAMQLAVKKGYNVAIISGGRGQHMIERLTKLGIKDAFTGVENKIQVFEKYLQDKGISKEQVLYMGDDIPDLEVMKLVGLATCPADAASEIVNISEYVSPLNGGRGCVRDVMEKVMKVQDKWLDKDAFQW